MHDVDPWPFDDPEGLATYTVERILSGAKPILAVWHDVYDGSWQFLTGEPVTLADAKLVYLGDMVAADPTLRELANLPLGWHAVRAAVGSEWVRTPEFPTEWEELIREACAYTEIQQTRLKSEFSLSEWERYDCNQKGATLVLSSGGTQGMKTRIQIVGSTSKSTGTWQWAWDDSSILKEASEHVHLMPKYGAQHHFERLVSAKWAADEVDGWEMVSVACLLLGGEGVYSAADENGALFMVLTSPELI